MSSIQLVSLIGLGFGAVCMLLGFYLVVRGIGGDDSESTIKLLGIEIRTSKVGPGILFALFGLVLTIFSIQKAAAGLDAIQKPGPPANTSGGVGSGGGENAAPPVVKPDAASPPEPTPVSAPTPTPASQPNREAEANMVGNAIIAIANGNCPPDILDAGTENNCMANGVTMRNYLLMLGPIQTVVYDGTKQTPNGVFDTFTVRHSNGRVGMWYTNLGPDGKLSALWYYYS